MTRARILSFRLNLTRERETYTISVHFIDRYFFSSKSQTLTSNPQCVCSLSNFSWRTESRKRAKPYFVVVVAFRQKNCELKDFTSAAVATAAAVCLCLHCDFIFAKNHASAGWAAKLPFLACDMCDYWVRPALIKYIQGGEWGIV